MQTGHVYLVGAGPGDPELLTIKAKRLIESCDALVYDYLVAEELLDWTRPDCEKHFVGKRSGFHSLPQSEIEKMLVKLSSEGKTVVRLKGGDPFVFGRGGEEVKRLRAHAIPYTVVPGITAALGAAAELSIPLTHRSLSSALVFLTGHEDPGKTQVTVDWRAYAATDATLCIYMGVGRLAFIAEELLAGGRALDTPCTIVEWAATPKQRSLHAPLNELVATARQQHIKAPAIIYIGAVTALGE